jgi:hypothetical protein
VPDIAAEFTVTEDLPLDVSVNVWVAAVFTVVFPKLRVVALTVSCPYRHPRPRIAIWAAGWAFASNTVSWPE